MSYQKSGCPGGQQIVWLIKEARAAGLMVDINRGAIEAKELIFHLIGLRKEGKKAIRICIDRNLAVINSALQKQSFRDSWNSKRRTRKHEPVAHSETPPSTVVFRPSHATPIPKTIEKWDRQKAEEFYMSEPWRRIRYDVIRRDKAQCQACGRSRKHGIVLHVDHIVPLSKDPSLKLDPKNLQTLCEDCNMGKGNRDNTDWRTPPLPR